MKESRVTILTERAVLAMRGHYIAKTPWTRQFFGHWFSGGQTGEWALVQEEQMSPLLTREKFH